VGLLLSLLALGSVAGVPLLHDALHLCETSAAPEEECSGWECPNHLLLSGLALVLLACFSGRFLASSVHSARRRPAIQIDIDTLRCQPLAPRAPPLSLI
jgi:hypothetical protein